MKIRVVFEIECSADTAWLALHKPTVATALYHPLLTMVPSGGPFAPRFTSGDSINVRLRLFGTIPLGTQRITISDHTLPQFRPGSRTMRDGGRPLTGALSLLRSWNHEITIWQSGPVSARWHDELTIGGAFAPLFFPVLALMWQWRKHKLRRLSRSW